MTDDTEPLTAEEPRRVREVRIVGDVWDLCDEAGLPRWPATGVAGDRCCEFGYALARLLDRHDEARARVAELEAERDDEVTAVEADQRVIDRLIAQRDEAERERDEARAGMAAAIEQYRMANEEVDALCARVAELELELERDAAHNEAIEADRDAQKAQARVAELEAEARDAAERCSMPGAGGVDETEEYRRGKRDVFAWAAQRARDVLGALDTGDDGGDRG